MRQPGFLRAGIVAALTVASASIGVVAPAGAQELSRTISNALGLTADEENAIDYRERPPLVVPPQMKLRPPEAGDLAGRQANWPQDPDLARRKAAEAERDRPVTFFSDRELDRPRLNPYEVRAGRRPGAGLPTEPLPVETDIDSRRSAITPYELRRIDRRPEQETVLRPGEEPQRRYLTEPPTGARLPAAGAALKATRDKPEPEREPGPFDFFLPSRQP